LRDVVGLAVERQEGDFAILRLLGGEAVEVFGLSLRGAEQFSSGPIVGFRVEDVRGARQEMEVRGVEFIGPVLGGDAGGSVYEITHRPGS
jgi:hypothetical protein